MTNIRTKKLKKKYDKMKYQLLSVSFSQEVHWQREVCLRTLMTKLKCTSSEAKRSTCFEPHFGLKRAFDNTTTYSMSSPKWGLGG